MSCAWSLVSCHTRKATYVQYRKDDTVKYSHQTLTVKHSARFLMVNVFSFILNLYPEL